MQIIIRKTWGAGSRYDIVLWDKVNNKLVSVSKTKYKEYEEALEQAKEMQSQNPNSLMYIEDAYGIHLLPEQNK
jgi:hypothetical protein